MTENAPAFGELVRLHHKTIYNFAMRRLGNASDAEDITQEAFARVFAHPPPVFESFVGYVCKAVRNLCIDRGRAMHGRHGERRCSFVDVDDLDLATNTTPGDELELRESGAAMREAFETLSPAVRRVIDLLFAGRTRVEVAEELGISKVTICHHVRTAVERVGGAV